jgi:hypothetical protein
MSLELKKLTPEEWGFLSQSAIKYSLGFDWPKEKNRVSYALIVEENETGNIMCYSTIIELDSESVYMQHGGNFPAAQGSILTTKGYLMMINYLREHYKSVSTRIWNKNKRMLKLAWAGGFVIQGMDIATDKGIMLIHELDMGKDEIRTSAE